MKTHLLSYRTKKIAVVLFVSLFALWNTHLNAQEIITFPNERYYWDRDTFKYDTDSSGYYWFHSRGYWYYPNHVPEV